jgi:hypothetical protein
MLLALAFVAAVGETLYVLEGSSVQPLVWDDASSWTFENGTAAGRVPVASDDVVFRDTRCKTWGTNFVLIAGDVTVRSVLVDGRRGVKGRQVPGQSRGGQRRMAACRSVQRDDWRAGLAAGRAGLVSQPVL